MNKARIILFVMACLLYFNISYAQGGGPPMITDDPGVVDIHKWEINTSVNLSIANETQLNAPYLDVNYGVAPNLQLKVESSYLFTFDKHHHSSGNIGEVITGIKFHFLKEDKSFISAGTYPQATLTGDQRGFLLPLLLEKTIGKFVIGEDMGIFLGEHNYRSFQNGILLGYQLSEKLQIMGEYFIEKRYRPATATAGYINYGFRYAFNKTFGLMGSFGKQVLTPAHSPEEYFISYLGIQSSF